LKRYLEIVGASPTLPLPQLAACATAQAANELSRSAQMKNAQGEWISKQESGINAHDAR